MNQTIYDLGISNEWPQAFKDSRKEPRFQAAGIGDLRIVNSATDIRLSAAIVDVSRSGLRIEVEKPLHSGSAVELSLSGSLIMGAVGNCRPHGAGRFRVGIRTVRVIESPLRLRHLLEVDHIPYVLNDALTEAQRHYYTQHLEICPACEQRVERTREALNTPG
jgi:hypothetical protein